VTGFVHVYTGNGKGKTTAALGLALRAAGAGMTVYIAQFLKSGNYSEIRGLARFSDLITVEQFGSGRFVKGIPAPEDLDAAARGLRKIGDRMASGKDRLMILDEAIVAVSVGVIPERTLLDIIENRPSQLELVLTGRGATPRLEAHADLVTEMKEIKHYYQAGIEARIGIEK
jgi:cob(I)alamin adenosyltransferase